LLEKLGIKLKRVITKICDAAEHLKTEEDNPVLIAAALGDIAKAKDMTKIAKETGLGRESLYKALSPEGNPKFSTVSKVVSALGLKLEHIRTSRLKEWSGDAGASARRYMTEKVRRAGSLSTRSNRTRTLDPN
jgi:probable addiction module antidote protein